MRNKDLGSRLVPLRIFANLSLVNISEPAESATSTARSRNLYDEEVIDVRRALISLFSRLSSRMLVLGSIVKLKNEIMADGSRTWCLENQSGVIIPSGKTDDPGVSGERGECKTVIVLAGLPVFGVLSSIIAGGFAFRGGRVNACSNQYT